MAGELWWDDEDAAHIGSRSARYPGADNLEPDWTLEAVADPHRVVRDPHSISGRDTPGCRELDATDSAVDENVGDVEFTASDTTEEARVARRARHDAILAEVVQEEAEAAEADIAEQASTLDMPLHLRIDRELDAPLRRRAAAEHIPTSALVRRLLRQAVHEHSLGGLTVAEVEDIARRVAREELHNR